MTRLRDDERHRYNAAVRQAYLALDIEDRAVIDRQKKILVANINHFGEQSALELLMKIGTALNGKTWELQDVLRDYGRFGR